MLSHFISASLLRLLSSAERKSFMFFHAMQYRDRALELRAELTVDICLEVGADEIGHVSVVFLNLDTADDISGN